MIEWGIVNMTTIDLIKQIFEVCIIPLFGVLTVYITSLIQKKTKEITKEADNEIANKYINLLSETITQCVIATNQTYVESLKKSGSFDAEAQKEAFRRTYESVMNILTVEAKQYLANIYGDLDKYITSKIESEVNINK